MESRQNMAGPGPWEGNSILDLTRPKYQAKRLRSVDPKKCLPRPHHPGMQRLSLTKHTRRTLCRKRNGEPTPHKENHDAHNPPADLRSNRNPPAPPFPHDPGSIPISLRRL